jgi:hypothetical protein
MYTLANDALEVAILDPVGDQHRFGPRYCTGGYIYQITDARHGELMTGPTYPDSFNWFDGQGIPDAFHLQPLRDPESHDAQALILGIGLCDPVAKEVHDYCQWDITQSAGDETPAITMRTVHTHANYVDAQRSSLRFVVELERTVTLMGRTIRSSTRLANQGKGLVPIRWYPHPFYPQPDTDELIKLNIPIGPIEHPHYAMSENGYLMRVGWPWDAGHYLALEQEATTNLVILQKHPKLGLVGATCSYIPQYFPVWGNPNTFSWEPYLERSVFPGTSFTWWIDYEF